MEGLIKDTRYGVRALRSSPGFAAGAIAAIALGIGANPAPFCLVHPILLRSLPFHAPASLVMVWEKFPATSDHNVVSPANYLDWKRDNRVFSDMAAILDFLTANLTGSGEPEELLSAAVSPNFFQLIGAQPMIGRTFLSEEAVRRDRV